MKSIGMMHIEAVRKLKEAGVKLKRTFHLSFVPGMCNPWLNWTLVQSVNQSVTGISDPILTGIQVEVTSENCI